MSILKSFLFKLQHKPLPPKLVRYREEPQQNIKVAQITINKTNKDERWTTITRGSRSDWNVNPQKTTESEETSIKSLKETKKFY